MSEGRTGIPNWDATVRRHATRPTPVMMANGYLRHTEITNCGQRLKQSEKRRKNVNQVNDVT